MRRRSLSTRLYRLFLRFFPSEFRGDFGDEMSQVFDDEHAEAATRGRMAIARLWWRTFHGLAGLASREHGHILMRDVGYGLRLMWKHRLTSAAALLTVALAVGANTAMFTVVKAVLLELPFRDPDRLVVVLRQTPRGYSLGFSPSQFEIWKTLNGGVESIAALSGVAPVLTGVGETRRISIECASANMFTTLGVAPIAGRTFTEREDTEGAEPVIVISEDFWTRRLGRDPAAVGRVLALDAMPATIVGIMPRAFDGPRAGSVRAGWLPLTDCMRRSRLEERPLSIVNLYARLAPGSTASVVEAQLHAALERSANPGEVVRVHLSPLEDQILGEIRQPLLALLGAAGFVLLIACANVASLLLGRADARRRELAVRFALGCTRGRMIRQLLTESVVFALAGGAAGLLIAHWSIQWLLTVIPGWVPRLDHIEVDGRVLLAGLGLSIVTGLLFGVLPAWYASQVSPGSTLKESTLLAGPHRRRARAVLILAEIALSVALLTGGGLLLETFLHLRPTDPGFDPRGKLAMTINLPRLRYRDERAWRTFLDTLLRRWSEQPGVRTVAATSYLPLSNFISQSEVRLDAGQQRTITVDSPIVTPDYFGAMDIRILRGRALTPDDRAGASEVALVNEAMARRLWPGEDPLGRQIAVKTQPLSRWATRTIVGIVRDVRSTGSRLGANPELFVPFAQSPYPVMRVVLSTDRSADELGPTLKAQLAEMDPALPVGDLDPVARITTIRSVAQWRFATSLMGAFAIVALVLAAVGLFAIVGCWVTERTSEIGVRMALGASRGAVLRMFVGRAALITALGLIVGLGIAALTTRFLATWLVGTSPLDRTTFAAAALIMAAVCLLATYLAARRATIVDPLTALRAE